MPLTYLWIALCPFLAPAAPPIAAPAQASVLSMVPDSSFLLVRCEDFAALRSRAERNDWMRLFGSKSGAPLMEEMARDFNHETRTDFDELVAVGKQLTGESVFFVNGPVAGFLTEAPVDRQALADAMRAWLPDAGPQTVSSIQQLGDARVELVAWPEEEWYGWTDRRGHFAAFVDHPRVLGLFSGDDLDSLSATLEASLGRMGAADRAPVVQGYEAARAAAPRCDGVELYLDFTPFVAEAEKQLAQSMEGVFPDPTGMLGLDAGSYLFVQSDVFPGTRVDGNAFLSVPKGTLAARLADTFQPLPANLPGVLPKGIYMLYSLRWDVSSFWKQVRAAFIERYGENSLQTVDGGLAAAKAMADIDPIVDVVDQLDGTFAFYAVDLPEEEKAGDWLGFKEFGFLASVVDGDGFLDAFERAIGGKPFEEELDLIDIEGVDVYTEKGGDDFDGGLAFLPRHFTVGLGRGTLTRALRALTGVADASLLDGSEMQGLFDQNAGCCFFTCQNLAEMRERHGFGLNGDTTLPPLEGEEQAHDPFAGTYLTSTARRTPDGFRIELRVR